MPPSILILQGKFRVVLTVNPGRDLLEEGPEINPGRTARVRVECAEQMPPPMWLLRLEIFDTEILTVTGT